MDDLLSRLEDDLLRVRDLYRLAQRRREPATELEQLTALGKRFRTELERFRKSWDPAERREAALAAGRVLGRIDAWAIARGPEFVAAWRR